jgi:hypothetical protein
MILYERWNDRTLEGKFYRIIAGDERNTVVLKTK